MRIRPLTLQDALALLPYTTVAASAMAVTAVGLKLRTDPAFRHAGIVLTVAGVATALAVAAGTWARTRRIAAPPWLNARGATSWVLALHLGILLLMVPVFALVTPVAADDVRGTWGDLNKQG